MFNPRKVYEYEKTRDADGNEAYRLARINPYISISAGGGPSVFLSGGQVHSAGGKVIPEDQWPAWLPGEIEKLSPQGRIKVGFPSDGDLASLAKSDDPLIAELKRDLDEARRQITELRQGFSRVDPDKPPPTSESKAPNGADDAANPQGSAW